MPVGPVHRLLWTFGLLGVFALPARGVEPVDAFLAALRERHFFDQAQDYLDQLSSDTRLPASVRQKVQFERGVTLIQSAAVLNDADAREGPLPRAPLALE